MLYPTYMAPFILPFLFYFIWICMFYYSVLHALTVRRCPVYFWIKSVDGKTG